jgi:hypothetical protein
LGHRSGEEASSEQVIRQPCEGLHCVEHGEEGGPNS